jgi:hypothetical protein
MANRSGRVLLALSVSFCMLFAGCRHSGPNAEVEGTVTIGGQPLAKGQVSFRPAADTSGPEFSATVVEGKYRVAALVLPGNYQVDVRSWDKTGRKVKDPFGQVTDEVVNVIPKRYWGPETTLLAHLAAGMNEIDFTLTSEPAGVSSK